LETARAKDQRERIAAERVAAAHSAASIPALPVAQAHTNARDLLRPSLVDAASSHSGLKKALWYLLDPMCVSFFDNGSQNPGEMFSLSCSCDRGCYTDRLFLFNTTYSKTGRL
jgi:hypothetical protein